MALNTTLGQLITLAREEAGMSADGSTGRNVRASIQRLIVRNYERLHAAFEWPHLQIRREVPLSKGERYYAFPEDMDFERVETAEVLMEGVYRWREVGYGIDWHQYNFLNSDLGIEAYWPRRWQSYEGGLFEIWPIPDHDGDTLRFHGMSNPASLVNEQDTADIDDNLIVLYTAAQLLARNKSPDAKLVLQQASEHFNDLKGRSAKRSAVPHAQADDRNPSWQGIHIVVPRELP